MGLVTSSNEASSVGTMTSGGTDVIDMSASTSRSTTGATVDVIVGDGASPEVDTVEKAVVPRVVGASVEATNDAGEVCAPDEVDAAAGAVALEVHEAARSTKATTPRTTSGKNCDLTCPLTTRARYRRKLS
jgi:hypothetical protein